MKPRTRLATGLAALATGAASMQGCGPMIAAYGAHEGNPAMTMFGQGLIPLEAQKIRADGERDAARILAARDNSASSYQLSQPLDKNQSYFFASTSPWVDKNLNNWPDNDEFGKIKDTFNRGESMCFNLWLENGGRSHVPVMIEIWDGQNWQESNRTIRTNSKFWGYDLEIDTSQVDVGTYFVRGKCGEKYPGYLGPIKINIK